MGEPVVETAEGVVRMRLVLFRSLGFRLEAVMVEVVVMVGSFGIF